MRFLSSDTAEDQSGSGRTLKVIGIGLPRCATSSLQAAFEGPHLNLGPCFHMAQVAPYPKNQQLVLDALREEDTQKRHKILYQLLDGYQSATDFPVCIFAEDLMDMYPDAQLILNQRKAGATSWVKSMNDTINWFSTWKYGIICAPMKMNRQMYRTWYVGNDLAIRRWGAGMDEARLYDVFQEWALRVAEKRGKKVLVWTADQGCDPICKLLRRPSPAGVGFPWVNDTSEVHKLQWLLLALGVSGWMAGIGSVYAIWHFWPQILARLPIMGSR